MAPDEHEVASVHEHALADEILAEVARQRRTSKSVQDESGVKARAWSNYLTKRNRHIPMTAVMDICEALGIKTSEMLRRAEIRAAGMSTTAQLEANLSPAAREVVEQERARIARERAAEGGSEDPPAAPGEGRRSA